MRRARRARDCPATEKLAVKCMWAGQAETVLLEAAIRGALAIHLSQGNGLPVWTVTHVATGYAIARFEWESEAEQFVREISALDWNFTDPSKAPQATQVAVALVMRSRRR